MLVHLEARGFRNLEPLAVDVEPGAHLILGPNGAGKTSFLEAIYAVATTRSFRTARLLDCVRHRSAESVEASPTEGFLLRAETSERVQLELAVAGTTRQRRRNGDRSSLAEHLAALPVIGWTQADGGLTSGPPADRRRFLDRGIVGERPAAIETIARYRQTLDAKRRLLADDGGDRHQLASWNAVLAPAAADLAIRRTTYVERLRVAFAQVLEATDLELPAISIRHRPSPASLADVMERRSDGDEEATRRERATEHLHEAFAGLLERERALGQPLAGPHRDELELRWAGHEVRRVASAGERKMLGLALVAAHGRVLEAQDREPVYLLDDVDIELDAQRLAGLWRHFGSARQLFATSNRPQVWGDVALAGRWSCRSGRFQRDA
ncbi:MAG: DNA replication and repair protein RecF [Acidobacteriota bacterium]